MSFIHFVGHYVKVLKVAMNTVKVKIELATWVLSLHGHTQTWLVDIFNSFHGILNLHELLDSVIFFWNVGSICSSS